MTLAEARQEEPLPLQVLVYGAEKKGVIAPGRELTSRKLHAPLRALPHSEAV